MFLNLNNVKFSHVSWYTYVLQLNEIFAKDMEITKKYMYIFFQSDVIYM